MRYEKPSGSNRVRAKQVLGSLLFRANIEYHSVSAGKLELDSTTTTAAAAAAVNDPVNEWEMQQVHSDGLNNCFNPTRFSSPSPSRLELAAIFHVIRDNNKICILRLVPNSTTDNGWLNGARG